MKIIGLLFFSKIKNTGCSLFQQLLYQYPMDMLCLGILFDLHSVGENSN